MWPITQSSPTIVGRVGMQWITVPSWIDVRAPMRIPPLSPRSTAPGHTVDSAPITTWPMMIASGWMYASGWISGVRSPSA